MGGVIEHVDDGFSELVDGVSEHVDSVKHGASSSSDSRSKLRQYHVDVAADRSTTVLTIHVEKVDDDTVPSVMPLDAFHNLVDRIRKRAAIGRHGQDGPLVFFDMTTVEAADRITKAVHGQTICSGKYVAQVVRGGEFPSHVEDFGYLNRQDDWHNRKKFLRIA